MTPQELAATVKTLPPEVLNALDHALLYQAREYVAPENQNLLAAPEHRAFAREATAENPLMALPIALATLAYQPYKALTQQSRSEPSLNQAAQGLVGVGEGLKEFVGRLLP